MCGENHRDEALPEREKGSPPRVRGKLARIAHVALSSRITPACAGKTFQYIKQINSKRDHPRVCGENLLIYQFYLLNLGSPPRVRGKLVERQAAITRERITPACAGKTHDEAPAGSRGQDHPRVCGENLCRKEENMGGGGSPPRVRGKLFCLFAMCSFRGITPACAGKTRSTASPSSAPRDHPRVCGENFQRWR